MNWLNVSTLRTECSEWSAGRKRSGTAGCIESASWCAVMGEAASSSIGEPSNCPVSRDYELGVGGAAGAGESYAQAASRELWEELGVRATVRPRFTLLNRAGLSPHWLGVCDAVLLEPVVSDPGEVAWHGWLNESELRQALAQWNFTPDSWEIFDRYLAGCARPAASPERGQS